MALCFHRRSKSDLAVLSWKLDLRTAFRDWSTQIRLKACM